MPTQMDQLHAPSVQLVPNAQTHLLLQCLVPPESSQLKEVHHARLVQTVIPVSGAQLPLALLVPMLKTMRVHLVQQAIPVPTQLLVKSSVQMASTKLQLVKHHVTIVPQAKSVQVKMKQLWTVSQVILALLESAHVRNVQMGITVLQPPLHVYSVQRVRNVLMEQTIYLQPTALPGITAC